MSNMKCEICGSDVEVIGLCSVCLAMAVKFSMENECDVGTAKARVQRTHARSQNGMSDEVLPDEGWSLNWGY